MEQPLLLALTPRAGKWNHRYLVAPAGVWSQEFLSALAGRAAARPQGENYLCVMREVLQSTTGRTARELVVLYDERLPQIAGHIARLRTLLEKCLQEIDELVNEKIDWTHEGASLLVERSELTQWQNQLAVQIEDSVRTIPQKERQMNYSSNPSRYARANTVGNHEKKNKRRIVFAGVISILIGAIGLWSVWVICGDNWLGLSSSGSRALDNSPASRLADLIGVELGSKKGEVAAKAVAEKLQRDMFQTDSKAEQRTLRQTLQEFHRLTTGHQTIETSDELVEDQQLMENLEKLYANGVFNPAGLLDGQPKEKAQLLDGIPPETFHTMIAQLQNLQTALHSVSELAKRDDDFYKFFHILKNNYEYRFKQQEIDFELCNPKFFLKEDVSRAESLSKLLNERNAQELFKTSSGADSLAGKLKLISDSYEDKKSPVWKEELELEKKKLDSGDPERAVFDGLQKFVETCHQRFSKAAL